MTLTNAQAVAMLDTEPTYTARGTLLAGWNRHDEPARVEARVIAHDPTGTDMLTWRCVAHVDPATRRDVVSSVRKALGDDCNAVMGLRAARGLLAMRSHPDVVAARLAAIDPDWNDGEAPDVMGAEPDAWEARNHETTSQRSNSGRLNVKRIKVGIAPVIGSLDPVVPRSDDAVTDDAVAARLAATQLLGEARRVRLGTVSFDITRATAAYRDLIPALIGSEVTSYQETIAPPKGTDLSKCQTTQAQSFLTGAVGHATVDSFAAPASVYRTQTRHDYKRADYGTRVKLGVGRHRALDARTLTRDHPTRVRQTGSYPSATLTPWRETLLIAGTGDLATRWQGHRLMVRPAPRRKASTRKARATISKRNQARDIGTVNAPTTEQGWRELLDGLNTGERVNARADDGSKVIVTRSAVRFRATDKRATETVYWESRTAEGLALKLA